MNEGTCTKCNVVLSPRKMLDHFKKCTLPDLAGEKHKTFLVRISAMGTTDYWLYIRLNSATSLKRLDHFLRRTWVECCGHLSQFLIEDACYSDDVEDDSGFETKKNTVKSGKVLYKGLKFTYEYDMGTTTGLNLLVIGEYHEKERDTDITLLARNNTLSHKCQKCGKTATLICSECIYEDGSPFLCNTCAKNHKCGEDMALPVVNSPRMGMCGYTG